eukprot:TRINITY_DN88_c0_g1_i1.p1 TRINITY_DN88_c0_g1~~TRINITY_DN88_c0_g1_i1.p1  ORF type:complete len:220 (+),score=49.92 TRINITY_DN88_c0_g1_i1:140-799(+)
MKAVDPGGNSFKDTVSYSFNGLLEGHESVCYCRCYRLFMFAWVCMTIVGIILPFASVGGPSSLGFMAPVQSIVLAGLLFSCLTLVRWYRLDGMEPKFKKVVVALLLLTLLGDVVGICMFSKSQEPGPEPTPPPTPVPTSKQHCKEDAYVANNQCVCTHPGFQAMCTDPLPYCPSPAPTPAPGGPAPPGPAPPSGPTVLGQAFPPVPTPPPTPANAQHGG